MATKKVMPPDVLDWFRKQGKRGGKVGGKLSAALLTDKERVERARQAGRASGKVRAAKAAAKKKKGNVVTAGNGRE